MIRSVVDCFPTDWRCTITVTRSSTGDATDGWGDPVADEKFEIPGCLLSVQTSTDPLDRSQVPTTHVVLALPARSGIQRGDTILAPADSLMPGRYAVIGDPMPGPLGDSALLERVTSPGVAHG